MARTVRLTRRKNPGNELPYGEWIPASRVKFNDNGTVSVETNHALPNRLQNIQGFRDPSGVFHPIRWDPHYDPDTAGEDAEYSIHPSGKFYKRTGLFAPKRKKRATGKRRR